MAFDHFGYIDEKRITSYYEQILNPGNPEEPYNGLFQLWPVAVKEALKISCAANPVPCYSLYEKTMTVLDHIRKSNQYSPQRNHLLSKGRDYVYYEETISAQKVHLSDQRSLWVAEKTCPPQDEFNRIKQHGHLLLIEGYSQADAAVKFYGGWSTFRMLVSHDKLHIKEMELAEIEAFNRSPIDMLSSRGHWIESPVKISALYRILATCRDMDNGRATTTLGYPIVLSTVVDKNP